MANDKIRSKELDDLFNGILTLETLDDCYMFLKIYAACRSLSHLRRDFMYRVYYMRK